MSKKHSLVRPNPWHGVELYTSDKKDEVTAYIEIVPTDRVKYELDKDSGFMKVDRPQKFSNIIPCLYGLLPKTYSSKKSAAYAISKTGREDLYGDEDPIDICVLTDEPITHGDILVDCKIIGGFRMLDHGEVDDKIIAVLKDDSTFGDMNDVADCPEKILNKVKHYFLTYKEIPFEGYKPKVEITHLYNKQEALEIIECGIQDYNEEVAPNLQ
ncbi:inorganic pyrophosphatase [Halobacteriovorax sp. GB3]|uniref:inorganic pyrophosphatase n=1 Tax=Halobacteriovorax sp. GB3 TaxID=2719615 RepID=UPI002362F65E|nr:inorganic pyrophosphatase [Halobacteriovorax sp. GB3]MDD0853597.1 inorganic pyrophosphatase [Halobacteriovorax sp. GB3]